MYSKYNLHAPHQKCTAWHDASRLAVRQFMLTLRHIHRHPPFHTLHTMAPLPPLSPRCRYGKDMSQDKRAVQKLRREVERAKRTLSTQHQVHATSWCSVPCHPRVSV